VRALHGAVALCSISDLRGASMLYRIRSHTRTAWALTTINRTAFDRQLYVLTHHRLYRCDAVAYRCFIQTNNKQAETDREREAYLAAQAPAAAPVAAAAAVFTHTVTGVAAGVRSASKLSPTGLRGRGRYLLYACCALRSTSYMLLC
jgi:cation transport regulator ChaC